MHASTELHTRQEIILFVLFKEQEFVRRNLGKKSDTGKSNVHDVLGVLLVAVTVEEILGENMR